MASSPELRVPLDEYLDIGEKKFVVEYPQKFILAQWWEVIWNKPTQYACYVIEEE